jgi:hypothetical protein
MLILPIVGAASFGAVVGWMACRVHQDARSVDTRWLAAMIGTIGGGAVMALFEPRSELFGSYCLGLAIGFFCRPVVLWVAQFFEHEARRELGIAASPALPEEKNTENSAPQSNLVI